MDYLEKLQEIKEKFDDIESQLSDPEIVSQQGKVVELSKKRSELVEIVEAYNEYKKILTNINNNQEIIESSDDQEFKELAEMEMD